MNTILDYLRSETAAHASTLHLDLDFSRESLANITEFCTWLRNHPYLTRIEFRRANLPSTGTGTDLSLVPDEALTQIFSAIQGNQRIQTVVLPKCNITQISDPDTLKSLCDCLAAKKDIVILANGNLPWLNDKRLTQNLSHIAVGKAEKLILRDIISINTPLSAVSTFLTDLASAKDKTFQYLSLSHNKLDGNVFSHIIDLLSLQITALDLSENPLALGATLEDWSAFFSTIQHNASLKTLSLKNCELWRDPISFEEDTDEQSVHLFQTMLLEFVRETHLSVLDLDLNDWEDDFLDQLRTAAQHNPHLQQFKCGHLDEAYDSLASKAGRLGAFPSVDKIRRDSGSSGHTSHDETSHDENQTNPAV